MFPLKPADNAAKWYAHWSYSNSGVTCDTQRIEVSQNYKNPRFLDANQVRSIVADPKTLYTHVPVSADTEPYDLIEYLERWLHVIDSRFAQYTREPLEAAA